MNSKIILNFIKRFNSADIFNNGCCYWFAFILYNRFTNSEIMYDIINNHFVTKINNKLYDINGEVTNKYNVISWDEYDDNLHKERIIRDCIQFK